MGTEGIFVFGSNLAGRHGRGAALHAAIHYGAIAGKGEGLHGRSYALPTKYGNLDVIPLGKISQNVMKFLDFADAHPELTFYVTAVGCGLAGYSPEQIAPMFRHPPKNVFLPKEFEGLNE